LISYSKEKGDKVFTTSNVLNFELGMLDKKFWESTDLNINEEELTIDDIEELESKVRNNS
jgi:hypothetical protein